MKKFSLIAFIAMIALARPAFSQEKSDLFVSNVTPIQIGEKSYPRIYIQDAFLNAAISRSYKGNSPIVQMLPIERYMAPNSAALDFFERTALEQRYPWLYSLVYPSFIPANDLVFHKWKRPIIVSLGYPNDFMPYTDQDAWKKGEIPIVLTQVGGYRKPDVNVWAVEQIKKDVPAIKEATALDIKFIPHEEENINNLANVRVVIVRHDAFGESKYKNKSGVKIGSNRYPIEMIEDALPYVAFTPNVDTQLSGYFVQNIKGEIQFAVCKIMEDHPKEIIQKLVRECLIRSLGFPSVTIATPSILSNWNNPIWKKKDVSSNADGSISDVDMYFIKSLYGQSISAGSTINDIL